MANARIQIAGDGYRIAVDDDYSAAFDFGEAAEAILGGVRYIALCDLSEGVEMVDGTTEADNVESRYEHWLYQAQEIDSEPEDVDSFKDSIEDDEDEGDEDEDDEGEDADEEVN